MTQDKRQCKYNRTCIRIHRKQSEYLTQESPLQAQYIFYNTTTNYRTPNQIEYVIQICRAFAHHRSLPHTSEAQQQHYCRLYIIIYANYFEIKDKRSRPSMGLVFPDDVRPGHWHVGSHPRVSDPTSADGHQRNRFSSMHSSMVTYFMSGYSSVASTPTLFCWIRWQSPSHAASPRRRRGMHAQSLAESWEGTRTLRQRQTASD